MDDVLESLLTRPARAAVHASIVDWWAAREGDAPVALALRGGFAAGGLGWAFAAGYQAALRAMVPSLGDELAGLCVSEGRESRPRDMKTTFVDGRLDGRKTYVTLGSEAKVLLVAAVAERVGDRVSLVLVQVRVPRAGAVVTPKAALPFVPELPHAEVAFAGCEVDAVLPGDGYDVYVKPFRTLEDTYVHLALTAYLLRVARQYGWAREHVEELVGLLAAGTEIAARDPKAALTHVVLAAHLRRLRAFIAASATAWDLVDPDEATRWRRDQPLLRLADAARAARGAAAWQKLEGA